MKWLHTGSVVLLGLALGAVGALGFAGSTVPWFRIYRFDVSADDDSLRSLPLADLLDSYRGQWFFRISRDQLRHDISAFKQVERVTIRRLGFTGFELNLAMRRPILMVTNGKEKICLGPGGVPFLYWPEHGDLPIFEVPSHISIDDLLTPDAGLADFYDIVRNLVCQSNRNLYRFSALAACDEYELHLMDRQTTTLLRLPRTGFRDPGSCLAYVHQWITAHPDHSRIELDLRFPGTILIRPWLGV
ncbi:hypothetical protein JXA80_02945 [bacterium]|nr:hypothetical protein [candidate division CSSED10-310 bacterium]